MECTRVHGWLTVVFWIGTGIAQSFWEIARVQKYAENRALITEVFAFGQDGGLSKETVHPHYPPLSCTRQNFFTCWHITSIFRWWSELICSFFLSFFFQISIFFQSPILFVETLCISAGQSGSARSTPKMPPRQSFVSKEVPLAHNW